VYATCFHRFTWATITKLVDSGPSRVPEAAWMLMALCRKKCHESRSVVFLYDYFVVAGMELGSVNSIEQCSSRGWVHFGSIFIYTEVDGCLYVPGMSAHCL
jgi:hypothetical protein